MSADLGDVRIDPDGKVYKKGWLGEEEVGRVDDEGRVYKKRWFGEEFAGRIPAGGKDSANAAMGMLAVALLLIAAAFLSPSILVMWGFTGQDLLAVIVDAFGNIGAWIGAAVFWGALWLTWSKSRQIAIGVICTPFVLGLCGPLYRELSAGIEKQAASARRAPQTAAVAPATPRQESPPAKEAAGAVPIRMAARLIDDAPESRRGAIQSAPPAVGSGGVAPAPANAALPTRLPPSIQQILDASARGDENAVRQLAAEARLLVDPQRGDRKAARQYNAAGLAKLNAENFAGAANDFAAGRQADPGDVEVVNNLGYALMLGNSPAAAEVALGAALALAPERASAWANLGQLYARQGAGQQALAALRNTVRFSGNLEKTQAFLTRLAESDNDATTRQAAAAILKEFESTWPVSGQAPVTPTTPEARAGSAIDRAPAETLAEARSCLAARRYDCTIAHVNSVLQRSPDSREALAIRQIAEQGQRGTTRTQ